MPDYLKPYEQAVNKHGGSFEATLWQSEKGQQLRFNAFSSCIDFAGCTMLDIGCGIGDFAVFLKQEKVQFNTFHGIDAMAEMIDTAVNRSLSNCTFSVGDVLTDDSLLHSYDWITCSGTLNAMTEQTASTLIKKAFQASGKGIAFNFLSDQCDRAKESKEDLYPARRFDTLKMLASALEQTPLVSFDQSYLNGHDATIIMRKEQQ